MAAAARIHVAALQVRARSERRGHAQSLRRVDCLPLCQALRAAARLPTTLAQWTTSTRPCSGARDACLAMGKRKSAAPSLGRVLVVHCASPTSRLVALAMLASRREPYNTPGLPHGAREARGGSAQARRFVRFRARAPDPRSTAPALNTAGKETSGCAATAAR